MGNGDDVLVKRGESVPIDFPGPVLVCTRNDDLEAVLESTPKSRWSGTITRYLNLIPTLVDFNFPLFLCFGWSMHEFLSISSRFFVVSSYLQRPKIGRAHV